MKKFYAISVLLVFLALTFIYYPGELESIDLDPTAGRGIQSIKPVLPDKAPIKRKEIKVLTENDVKDVKLVNVEKIPPRGQLIIKSIKRGANTVIRSKNRQDEIFVLKEINALSPNFQTTLGTDKKKKMSSNQRLFIGSSGTRHSAHASQVAMAFFNRAISGIITRPDGTTTYIQSDTKTGKIFSYTTQESELDCSEKINEEGEVTYTLAPQDFNLEEIKAKGEEVEILAAENSNTGGTKYDEEESGKPTGINPPEYDKSLININWLMWVDKSSTNVRDGDGNLIFTLEEHAAFQLVKLAMMNAIYQNQLGIKFTLQEIVLIPENDPQDDPVYTSDEPTYAPDMTQPQYCLQAGARCGPIGGAKHLMEKYRPREIYHWDQVPYQMKKKEGDTYKWGGLAGCCAGSTSGVYVNNFSTGGLGAIPHETGHNIGVSHLMGGGIMGGSAIDGRSFFSFVREGSLKGIELGSNQAYNKMSQKSWFTSLHPKYSSMRNPKEIPWAVGDNYQLVVGSDPSSRNITISPMDNDLLFTPEGKWNQSLDIPEIGPIYPPNAGVLTLLPDNQVNFIANEGFYGPVKFRYTLRGHLPAYLHGSTDLKCLHANKYNSTYSNIEIENCDTSTETPENKDYNFNIPNFPGESPIFKIKNNGGCIRPYSGSEDTSTYVLKNFADVFFVGACSGEENWDKWIFEPVAMDISDVFRIKNKFTGFCLNSMKNIQSDCNDVNNYWQVKSTPDPSPGEKCVTGGNHGGSPAPQYLKDCGDLDSENRENQNWSISDFPNESEIKKGNSGSFLMKIDSQDNTVPQEGLGIHLKYIPWIDYIIEYGDKWTFIPLGPTDHYQIKNSFSSLCLGRGMNQIPCSNKETTWKITPDGSKWIFTAVPDGNYDTTYQLVSVRQQKDGWLHAGDVTIDVVEGTDAPNPSVDLAENLQVTIPMNSYLYFGKDADIEEFYFNPLIDLTLMPQTLDGEGNPISIYRSPIQMDLTLGTSDQYQSLQRNAISIKSVDNQTPTIADYRVIEGTFTEGGVSKKLANGYLAVKLKRDGNGDYNEGPVTFNVEVIDQKGEEKVVTVNLIPPISRINLDRVELPVNESLNLTTLDIASSPNITWRKIYGPGNFVVSGNTADFSEPGRYLLRMIAQKGLYTTYQEVDLSVLTESGDKATPEAPPGPGEAPATNQIIIAKDGTQYIITPDGQSYSKDPVTGIVTEIEEDYKQFSLVNKSNYSYLNSAGFIFVMINGTLIETGVKGNHVTMGVDGFILAIFDNSECLSRGKNPGCVYSYSANTWSYWGYQKFTGKNSLHQTIEEMKHVQAKDIHVLSKDHIAFVDLNGALFEMSEHETRGKEFWELGGLWRKVKISIHGRIVGIGEDNTLKKLFKESWYPIKPNVGDFALEHNGRITALDFDNNIEMIPELYLSDHKVIGAGSNDEIGEISLGPDGFGHYRRFWANGAKSLRFFNINLDRHHPTNTHLASQNYGINSVADSSNVCVSRDNSNGLKIYKVGEDVDPPTIASFQENIVCSSDGAIMSIITEENATDNGLPKSLALQLVEGEWYPLGGKLAQIDIGSEHFIYGVDQANRIWKKEGKVWKRIPGLMKQIAVGNDGTLVGIGTDDFLYLSIEGSWVNLDAKAKKIAASINNQIAYIGMDDKAYTNYSSFFSIPVIHDIKKSFLRPRKGVAYRKTNNYQKIHELLNGTTIWEAINLPDGCVNLGQIITENNLYPNFETRCYEYRENVMKHPVSYEELAVLDVPDDIRVFRPVPEAGFSCVSHIAWPGADPPPVEHIYCIDSGYIENGVLESKGNNLFRIMPANGKSVTKNYFQYWEENEVSQGPSSFYIPAPKTNPLFSLIPQAHAAEASPTVDPDEAPIGGALVGEEFLTTPENLAALDDELEELADDELEEVIDPLPDLGLPGGDIIGDGSPGGGMEGATSPRSVGKTGAVFQSSCGKTERTGPNSSWFFISNFLIGFILTIFRRRK